MKGRVRHPDSHRDYFEARARLAGGIRVTNLASTCRLELFRVRDDLRWNMARMLMGLESWRYPR